MNERTPDPDPNIVTPETMLHLRELLRATATEIRRCWWCARPLEQGICPVCDRE